MFGIKSVYTVDHDSCAGYSGRIGYRYKTVVIVQFRALDFNKARRTKTIGSLVVDVSNHLYNSLGFKQTYNPQIDTKARARNGVTEVKFEFFHNSDSDIPGYTGYAYKYHRPYQGESSQYALDPNNHITSDPNGDLAFKVNPNTLLIKSNK